MPIFSFKCVKCELDYKDLVKDLTKFDDHLPCPECGTLNHFITPSGASTIVYETGDKGRGVKLKKGLEKQLKDRMNKHHDKYEVAEKIDKFGTASAERHGWYKKDKKV
jgi:predicted nucleic acid-binding Zn ribbon protein